MQSKRPVSQKKLYKLCLLHYRSFVCMYIHKIGNIPFDILSKCLLILKNNLIIMKGYPDLPLVNICYLPSCTFHFLHCHFHFLFCMLHLGSVTNNPIGYLSESQLLLHSVFDILYGCLMFMGVVNIHFLQTIVMLLKGCANNWAFFQDSLCYRCILKLYNLTV